VKGAMGRKLKTQKGMGKLCTKIERRSVKNCTKVEESTK